MRLLPLLLFAPLVGTAGEAQAQSEHGAFVTTLGQDTVAIDQYVRTPRFLDGALLLRSPVTRVATYKALLRTDGTIERMETRWWTPAPDAGPPQPPDMVATFMGDSVRIEFLEGADTRTVMVAAGEGTVPLVNSVYSAVLYEQALRQAGGTHDFEASWLALDRRGRVSSTSVAGRGADSVAISYFAGTMVARVDKAGHILGLTGQESTAKFRSERVEDVDMELLAADFGARDAQGEGLGTMSPPETTQSTVAGATIQIDYSRPSKRGRVVWGGVVPWSVVWRTGANRATHIATDKDLSIEGVALPAGGYTLFTWPTPDETLLVISKQTNQWGTVYDQANDLARIPMHQMALPETAETFTIVVEADGDGGIIGLEWDDRRYWVSFEVPEGM